MRGSTSPVTDPVESSLKGSTYWRRPWPILLSATRSEMGSAPCCPARPSVFTGTPRIPSVDARSRK